jgi:hypothetical protein
MLDLNIITKPFATIWQFFMTDTPQIIAKVECQPRISAQRSTDFIYTVQLPENHPNRLPGKDTRQVHRSFNFTEETETSSYTGLFLIKPEFEGEKKFFGVPEGTKVLDGWASDDVVAAIMAHDGVDAKKKAGTEPGERHDPDNGARPARLVL